jgi:hypothetical protein
VRSSQTKGEALCSGDYLEVKGSLKRSPRNTLKRAETSYHFVVLTDKNIIRGTIDQEVSDGLYSLIVHLPGEGITLA